MRAGPRLLAVLIVLGTAGCGDTRKALGFEKNPPDEFQVISRAPLSMPPDFALRPPDPGAPRPQEQSPREQAQTVVFGSGGTTTYTGDGSPGEAALLQQAGRMVVDDVPFIPTHFEVSSWAARRPLRYAARVDQYTVAMGVRS